MFAFESSLKWSPNVQFYQLGDHVFTVENRAGLKSIPSLSSTQGYCPQYRSFLFSPTSSMYPYSRPLPAAHKHAMKSGILKKTPSIWPHLPLFSLFLFPEKLSKELNLLLVLTFSPPVLSRTHSIGCLPSPRHWNRYCQGHTSPFLEIGNSAKCQGQSPISTLN